MRNIIVFLASVFGTMSSAIAGAPLGGFSTFQISWTGASVAAVPPETVPTMSTYAIVLLAVLLALVVYRASRSRGSLFRAIAPLATFGIAASFTLMSESPVAGLIIQPPIDGSSCSGSQEYSAAVLGSPPPCFVNTCGSPVTVAYTLVDGEAFDTTPLTEETCTLAYFCDGGQGEGEGDAGPALDGADIPSDGLSYATAYCEEIFEGEGGEGPP